MAIRGARTAGRLVGKAWAATAGWGPSQVSSGGPGAIPSHWVLDTLQLSSHVRNSWHVDQKAGSAARQTGVRVPVLCLTAL